MIRVGIAGWSYPDWQGIVYPKPAPRGFDALEHIARFVSLLELNSSFYAIPQRRSVERWAEIAQPRAGLLFTAKLERGFTHAWRSSSAAEHASRARAFEHALEPLAASRRLRALLAQFPLSFEARAAERAWLRELRGLFPSAALVLELRHRSWYAPERLHELDALGFALSELDLPAHAEHLPEQIGGAHGPGYLRLHGRNSAAWFDARAERDQKYDYLYDRAEIEQVAQRARRLEAAHGEALVLANNHFRGKALANALELLFLLHAEPQPAPAGLLDAYPHLRGALSPVGQPGLF